MGLVGQQTPVVMIPRFSSFFGATDFVTVALDVSEFSGGTLTLWRGALQGTSSPSFGVYAETSHDGITWTQAATTPGQPLGPAGAGLSMSFTATFTRKWFRVRVSLTGTDPAVTCWCTGLLERRVNP